MIDQDAYQKARARLLMNLGVRQDANIVLEHVAELEGAVQEFKQQAIPCLQVLIALCRRQPERQFTVEQDELNLPKDVNCTVRIDVVDGNLVVVLENGALPAVDQVM